MNIDSLQTITEMDVLAPESVLAECNGCKLGDNDETINEVNQSDREQARRDLEEKVRALARHLGEYEYCPKSRLYNAPYLEDIPRAAMRLFGAQPEIPIVSIGGVDYINKGMIVHMLCTALATKAYPDSQVDDADATD